MEWRLTSRDWWWLSAAPAAAALLLGWFWALPLLSAARDEARARDALGDEPSLHARIAAARARVRDAQADLDATRERLAAPDPSEVLPPAAPPDTLQRFRLVSELCRRCGVQVVSATRTDADRSGSLARSGLPVDDASEYWCFKIRASMAEAAALLRAVEAAPATSLVDSLALDGMPVPGEKRDWTLTLWL